MAHPSPPVQRVVAVLNFFVNHPEQSFTFSDVLRALKISRATCHSVLAGLVESGYLYRTNDKCYIIGPTLAAVGRISSLHFSPLQVAQPEMRALADEWDVICSAYFRERDEVVVRATAAAMSPMGLTVAPGTRVKLRTPLAAPWFAWAAQAEADAWLASLDPPPSPEQHQLLLDNVAFLRQHGYSFAARTPHFTSREKSNEQLRDGHGDYPIVLATGIEAERSYPLTSVLAPVFDSQRQVVFVLGLVGFSSSVSGAKIEQMGQRLREACDRITTFIVGKVPA